MDEELSLCHLLKTLILRRMIKMTMSVNDVNTAKVVLGVGDQNLVCITSWIDDSGLSCPLATQDVTVRLNRSND